MNIFLTIIVLPVIVVVSIIGLFLIGSYRAKKGPTGISAGVKQHPKAAGGIVTTVLLLPLLFWFREPLMDWVSDFGSGNLIFWGVILFVVGSWAAKKLGDKTKKYAGIPAVTGLAMVIIGASTSGFGEAVGDKWAATEQRLETGNWPSTASKLCPSVTLRDHNVSTLRKGDPVMTLAPQEHWSQQVETRIADLERYGNYHIRYDYSVGLCVLAELPSGELVMEYYPPMHERGNWEPPKLRTKTLAFASPQGVLPIEVRYYGDQTRFVPQSI